MVDANLLVAVVSLVIAIIAFLVASLQTIQQFAATAEGFRACRETVIALWAVNTRRVFSFTEMRFKVMFETPVIFVAQPGNWRGPLIQQPIFEITGTQKSYNDTHCRTPDVQHLHDQNSGGGLRVRTADDEYASWVVLMESLQSAEAEGRQWDMKSQATMAAAKWVPEIRYSLVVQVQSKKRTWDSMPDSVRKPFATTNISHIIELAALLGMQWTKFDQDTWNMRAQGNGFMFVSHSDIFGLGVSVSFSVSGISVFRENRIIPCYSIKSLLFGTVDTIFKDLQLNFEPKKEDWEDMLITLRTLRRLKVSRETMARYFHRKEHSVVRSGKHNILSFNMQHI